MNNRSKLVFFVFISLIIVLSMIVLYIDNSQGIGVEKEAKKYAFVELTALPDLAISTEATYIRHRSLSEVFSIYKDDGSLREYFPSTFVYSHSHILNNESSYVK